MRRNTKNFLHVLTKAVIVLVIIIVIIFATGCSSLLDSISTKGAEANDKAVAVSIFTLCEGGSIGSIRREFDTPEEAKLWLKLCSRDSDGFTPTGIE